MFKQIFLPLIGVALFIVFVGSLSQGKLDSTIEKIAPNAIVKDKHLKTIKINDIEINVEVAKTNEERSRGLSNRTKLDENSGMIFVFNQNSKPVFWMKDTKIALDLIWINDNKIVEITKDVQPEIAKNDSELKKYSSANEIDYVLEVNGGFSDKNKINVGQNLSGLEQL